MITPAAIAATLTCKLTPFEATTSDEGFPISIQKINSSVSVPNFHLKWSNGMGTSNVNIYTCHPDSDRRSWTAQEVFVHRSLDVVGATAWVHLSGRRTQGVEVVKTSNVNIYTCHPERPQGAEGPIQIFNQPTIIYIIPSAAPAT